MDLKDITRGLRGGDERTRADDQSHATTGSRSTDDRDSPTDGSGDAAADRVESPSENPASAEPERDDVHVCSFCETEFDADRGACPECDAEIVIRGTR